MYTIIVNAHEIAEAQANTREPFADLFVTRLPSEREEVGYERTGDTLIIKYEENEDGRITTDKLAYEFHAVLPRIFGVIMNLHYGVTKIKLGKTVHRIEVLVNDPEGVFYNEPQLSGKIIKHEVSGVVFIRTNDTYSAVNAETLALLNSRFIKHGHGIAIDSRFLVRFNVNGAYVYEPMSRVFNDPLVAASFNDSIHTDNWSKKNHEILATIGVAP